MNQSQNQWAELYDLYNFNIIKIHYKSYKLTKTLNHINNAIFLSILFFMSGLGCFFSLSTFETIYFHRYLDL